MFLRTNVIPNSESVYTTFLSPEDLRKALTGAVGAENVRQIINGKRRVIASCGSGMTAGVLWLGLKLINQSTNVAIYDEVFFALGLTPQLSVSDQLNSLGLDTPPGYKV